jgi:hypothetical protein
MPDLAAASSTFNGSIAMGKLDTSLDEIKSYLKAPLLVLLQSSGYGKTRLALEKIKTRRGVYALCKDIDGGWKRPDVVSNMITRLKQAGSEEERERVAVKMITAFKFAALDADADTLFKQQFDDEGNFGNFFSAVNTKWLNEKTPPTSPVDPKKPSPANASTPAQSSDDARLLIVFDEATGLGEGYHALRRVLRSQNVIGIFLDTSSKLTTFLPAGEASDRSAGLGELLLPIFDFPANDVAATVESQPFAKLFTKGRPLWSLQLKHRCDHQNLDELVRFAAHKLAPAAGRNSLDLCAMFVCRFGMGPHSELAADLAASNLATLVAISRDRKTVLAKYHSEPVLAEASALLTYETKDLLLDVLGNVADQLDGNFLSAAKGDRGEVAAAAALGYLADKLREPKKKYHASDSNFSKPCPVLDLLVGLCPSLQKNDDLRSKLEGWVFNFNHCYQLSKNAAVGVLDVLWDRHAAAYAHVGAEGLDLFFPCHKGNEVMTVRIQVKNYKASISRKAAQDLLCKLSPRRCAPRTKELFSVGVLVNVGEGGVDSFCANIAQSRFTRGSSEKGEMLVVACDFNDFQLPKQVVAALKRIAGPPSDLVFASKECVEGAFAAAYTGEEVEEESADEEQEDDSKQEEENSEPLSGFGELSVSTSTSPK